MPFAMRTLALLLALAPALAGARPWQGITPGTSTQQEVAERFGEPTTRTKRTGRTILAYYGDQALSGTRQAQFHVNDTGVVQEITIFLTAQLDAESIEGTYGKPPQRTFVEDTFQKVWLYPQAGVTVYFNKEGNVEALTFAPGSKAQAAKTAPAEKDPPAAHPASR
jgi:outer membrane protein assembly factor BamE (lipoprotein component of BamABCDE complex)